MARVFPSVVIENLQPLIDGGRYPIKRIVGEDLVVDADIFKDGHDVVAAILKGRVLGKRPWRGTPLNLGGNEPWPGGRTFDYKTNYENKGGRRTATVGDWQTQVQQTFDTGG